MGGVQAVIVAFMWLILLLVIKYSCQPGVVPVVLAIPVSCCFVDGSGSFFHFVCFSFHNVCILE